MYLIKPYDSTAAILVDPVDHRTAAHELSKQEVRLDTILCTHHHADHDSGNEPLKRLYPQAKFKNKDHAFESDCFVLNCINFFCQVNS